LAIEPVNTILSTPALTERRAGLAVAGEQLHEVGAVALGLQGLVEDPLDPRGRPRGPLADFNQCRVAGHDRGDRRGDHVLQREVPRADDADDAERVVLDRGGLVHQQARRDALGAEGLLGVAEVPAQGLAHRPQLDGGVLEGLAGVAGDHSAQLVAVLEDVVEDPADDPAAHREARGPPRLLGDARAGEASDDLVARPSRGHRRGTRRWRGRCSGSWCGRSAAARG
jgi:hypothetical protein